MITGAALLLLGSIATAQTKQTKSKPAPHTYRVTDSDTLPHRANTATPNKDLLYNNNANKIDLETAPSTTPPRRVPAHPDSVIYTTPKDRPQIPPIPPAPPTPPLNQQKAATPN